MRSLEVQRQQRMAQLGQDRPFVAGSLNRVERKDQHGRTTVYHLPTFKEAEKTRSVYVPKEMLKEVNRWMQNYRRIKQLPADASTLSIAIIQQYVPEKRVAAARFRDNGCVFSRAKSETVICSKQMINVLARLNREEISALRPEFLKTPIRQKQVPDLYLLGHVMMAGDGTGIFVSSAFHCPQFLTQKHQDGPKTYLHNVLEIKAVGWNGLAISVLTEPELNAAGGTYDKQDCETKAFRRA